MLTIKSKTYQVEQAYLCVYCLTICSMIKIVSRSNSRSFCQYKASRVCLTAINVKAIPELC